MGCIAILLGPMNMNEGRKRKSIHGLNHAALSLSLAILFVDLIKMVFVYDVTNVVQKSSRLHSSSLFVNQTVSTTTSTSNHYLFQ